MNVPQEWLLVYSALWVSIVHSRQNQKKTQQKLSIMGNRRAVGSRKTMIVSLRI